MEIYGSVAAKIDMAFANMAPVLLFVRVDDVPETPKLIACRQSGWSCCGLCWRKLGRGFVMGTKTLGPDVSSSVRA